MTLAWDYDIELSDADYRKLAQLIYEKSGINLGDEKKELLKARLMKRMRAHRLRSWRQYYDYLIRDTSGQELVAMLDAIATNVTQFFREKAHFDFLEKTALPKIIEAKEKKRDHVLRVWSAAVATGEEIYSLVMTVQEWLQNSSLWKVKALGTDISTKALFTAQNGVYAAETVKDLPVFLREKYFLRQEQRGSEAFRVKDALRRLVVFRRVNLVSEPFPFMHKFDIIFCRNLMIYFDKGTQALLIRKLAQYLDDHGYFFIGHAESLIGVKTDLVSVAPAVYHRA